MKRKSVSFLDVVLVLLIILVSVGLGFIARG